MLLTLSRYAAEMQKFHSCGEVPHLQRGRELLHTHMLLTLSRYAAGTQEFHSFAIAFASAGC
jgi:hypothetical protein